VHSQKIAAVTYIPMCHFSDWH